LTIKEIYQQWFLEMPIILFVSHLALVLRGLSQKNRDAYG